MYLRTYVVLQDGARAEKEKYFLDALVDFQDSRDCLRILHDQHPDFEIVLLEKRIADCNVEIAKLKPLAREEVLRRFHGRISSGPPLSMLYDDGLAAEKAHDDHALIAFEECRTMLEIIHDAHPAWESALVQQRLYDCSAHIVPLQNRLAMPERIGPGDTVQ